MQLLTVLTVIYAIVLVLALAASLIAILVALRRVSTVLGEVRAALGSVPADTQPLEPVLRAVRDAADVAARDVEQTRNSLERADQVLRGTAERHGAIQAAR